MHRNAIALIWACGLLVAVIAYAADPASLLDAALGLLATATRAVASFVQSLSAVGAEMLRALALGLFAIFAALAVLAIRRGGQGRAALLAVSAVFVLLVRDAGADNGRWAAAFALAAVGALVMTGRVRRPPP